MSELRRAPAVGRANHPIERRGLSLAALMSCTMLASAGLFGAAHAEAAADVPDAAPESSATPSASVEEVVVTAQRRSENLQNVPLAVTALSGNALEKANIRTTEDLNIAVPGLMLTRPSGVPVTYIRGVGQNSVSPGIEQPVAFSVDGVYIFDVGADISSFNNVDHVEVLKGPQGTLFGRNATGGLIQVVTKDPSHTFGGRVSAGYDSYETPSGSLYVTGGITDWLAADFAINAEDQLRGWGHNLYNGDDTNLRKDINIRSKWLLTPYDKTKITIAFDYSNTKTDAGQNRHALNGPVGGAFGGYQYAGGFYDTDLNSRASDQVETYGVAGHVEQDLDWFRVVDIISLRNLRRASFSDSDFTPVNVQAVSIDPATSHSFSNELQVLSNESSPIKWIGGLYYFRSFSADNPLDIYLGAIGSSPFENIYSQGRTESWAGYAQATVPLAWSTDLTAGIRYTNDRKSIAASIYKLGAPLLLDYTDSHKWENVSYRVGLEHHFTDDVMGYISLSTGFRAGVYGLTSPTQAPVNPETLTDVEGGIKSELFDHRLRLNLSAFHYDYKDLQLLIITGAGTSMLQNAAKAEIYGGELEANASLTAELTLHGSMSLQHSEYTSFPDATTFFPLVNGVGVLHGTDATGNELMRSPNFTSNLGLDWRHDFGPVETTASVSWYHNGGFYWEQDNVLRQGAYDIVNGSITFAPHDKPYDVRVWIQNLGGEHYYISEQSAGGFPLAGGAGQPRTFGITANYSF